jgi:UDP-2,4-diacetamido-2,4,6-trideoxy-beta-L-altropyranose hydrolase
MLRAAEAWVSASLDCVGDRILTVRADAGADIGSGHVMRCLALAQAWRARGGEAVFVATAPPALEQRLRDEGMQVVQAAGRHPDPSDWESFEAALDETDGWVVLDGYHFDDAYERRVVGLGRPVCTIDDRAERTFAADVILNQNIGAETFRYRRAPSSRVLAGTRHVLLRSEFLALDPREAQPARARRVLVTLGGGASMSAAATVVEALDGEDVELDLAIGPGAAGARGLLERLARDRANVSLHHAADMPALMSGADLAVAAGGTTTWELAYLRVPTVLAPVAANQRENARRLASLGAAAEVDGSDASAHHRAIVPLLADRGARERLAETAHALVDGRGAERVLDVLDEPFVRLRQATPDDARLLFDWANDPVTRANSFSTEPIPWPDHTRWLERRLADDACALYVVEDATGRPVGQVRLDDAGDETVVSVALAADARGRGLGTAAISAAARSAQRNGAPRRVRALIKPENTTSLRAFETAGFKRAGGDDRRAELVYEDGA